MRRWTDTPRRPASPIIVAGMRFSYATLFRWLRIAAAGGIVIWLAARAGVEAIARNFTEINLVLLAAALALLFADSLAKAWNWRKLIASLVTDREVPFAKVMSWFFAGGFLGVVVPSSASTDVLRAYLSQRALGGHGPACAASVLTLNGIGWLAGCLLGLLGIALLALGRELPLLLGPAAFAFIVMAVLLPVGYVVLAQNRRRVLDRMRHLRWQKLKEVLRRFVDAVCVFERAHVRFLQFLVISVTGVLAQAGMFALTAAAVGVYLPFAVWMILAPLTRLIALVPVSVMDFGLIQGAHVWLLALFDVPTAQAFVISTLFALQGAFIHSTAGSVAFVYGDRANLRLQSAGR
jgi:uncharacterized protein (TIRG00374 family)